jgi:glycerol-3-phosphate acyltransferase PlsX
MGREYARTRLGVAEPTIGLLSNGEEPNKGDALRKAAHPMLAELAGFVGNVEGRDLMRPGAADVVVTDGFTGNVALKTVEGVIAGVSRLVLEVLDSTPELREASKVVLPALLDAASVIDPDHTGGAVLLGVNGICVISHGSSNALAIESSVRRAVECVEDDVLGRLRTALRNDAPRRDAARQSGGSDDAG